MKILRIEVYNLSKSNKTVLEVSVPGEQTSQELMKTLYNSVCEWCTLHGFDSEEYDYEILD